MRPLGTSQGAPAIVVEVGHSSPGGLGYPTVANAYYFATVVSISGPEAEGDPAILGDTDRSLYVYNIGPTVIPAATNHLATLVDGHWIVDHGN